MSWLFWLLIGLGAGLIILGFYYFNATRRAEAAQRAPFPLGDTLRTDPLDAPQAQPLASTSQEPKPEAKKPAKLEPRIDTSVEFDELGVSPVRLRQQDEAEAARLAATVRTRRTPRFSYKDTVDDASKVTDARREPQLDTGFDASKAELTPTTPQNSPPNQHAAPQQPTREDTPAAPSPKTSATPDVIPLYLVARQPSGFAGHTLLSLFAQHGFEFGEMSVYHYTDAHGEVLFSLMNGVAPGTFDPNTLPAQSTPALALFLRLPIARQPNLVLEQFLELAYHMANALDARILDEQREELSPESVDRMRAIVIDD
ncbi:MAG: cell division protein ZipA C-terminal FtsZ-binding domain-containing protein [Halothiobacillaceae bacterium]